MKVLHACSILALALPCFAAALPTAATTTAASNSSSYYGITGVQTGLDQNGGRPERREITEMATNDPQSMSLYIQALNSMQAVSEDDPLSYFQIAGIHGRPYIEWNKAHHSPTSIADTGYCTHNSNLFLTWHRPYVALFEQVLATHIQAVVKTYDVSEQAVYQAKADALRLVYWDWAAVSNMPPIILQPTISIITGTGVQVVRNPFYSYKFQLFPMNATLFPSSNLTAGDWWLADYSETVRGLQDQDVGGSNNFDLVNQVLATENLMSQTWLALSKQTTYNEFCTTAVPGTSLENVHNIIHACVGLNGHMNYLSYGAFDPIFWLHHANVDRLYAYWEAMHPSPANQTMEPISFPAGTYAIPQNTVTNSQTPLMPFTSTANGPWFDSTASNRATKRFGYTYSGLNDWNMTVDEMQSGAITLMQQLYNPNGQFTKRSTSLHNTNTVATQSSVLGAKEWFVAVSVDKLALAGQRFNIQLSTTNSTHIGTFPIFPPPIKPNAAGALPVVTAYSEYSLRSALDSASVDMEDVASTVAWLKGKLQWVVTRADGSLVDLSILPSLTVEVYEESVARGATAASLPVWGWRVVHGL